MRATVLAPVILLVGLAIAAADASARAAELVMVEEKGCPYCAQWDAEVGVIYHKTPQGQRAPLRRVEIGDPLPDDLQHLERLFYTPTFILIEDGREVGRITGYPGEDFFWGLLEQLMAKLDARRAGDAS